MNAPFRAAQGRGFLPLRGDEVPLRAALLELGGVRDAVLRRRAGLNGSCALCAFVVADPLPAADAVRAALGLQEPLALVPVSDLPYDGAGALDEAALAEMPVVTPELLDAVRATAAAPARLGQRRRLAWTESETILARSAGPALIEGGVLPEERAGRICLADALVRTAAERGEVALRFIDGAGGLDRMTYGALHDAALRIAGGFRAAGMHAGQPVLMQLAAARDFLCIHWGAVYAGLVPVPVGVPVRYAALDQAALRVREAAELFPQAPFVTDQGRREALRQWVGERPILTLEAVLEAAPVAAPHRAAPDVAALYLLTSGSTSRPKIVVQTHAKLLAQCRAAIAMNGIGEEDVSLNWLPLDHVGGIVMCHLRDAYLGAPQIHAAPQAFLQDPLRWLDWMSAHRVANTWAPNFAFNLVCVEIAKRGRRDWDLSGLRLVLNGGEAVARGYAENFLRALAPCGLRPEAMRPVWGMSETASGSVICDRFHADMARGTTGPVSVGRPLPGNAIRIVDEHGVTVTEGVIGRLQTTGATVLDAYLDNPEANRRAFTADGWFDTGDLGVVTGGRLCLMGRNKDVIIVNGQNIDPGMVEAQIDGLPGVVPSFTAVVVRHDVQHSIDRVSVFFAPEPAAALEPLLQKIRGRLAGTFGIQVEEIVALPPGAVPKTSIGKIQKERLKAGLDSGQLQPAYRRPAEAKGAAGEEAKLPGIWRRVWRPRRLQTSPADLQLGVIADGAPVHARLAAALNSAGIAAVLLSADRIAEPDLVARHLVLVTEPGIPVATVLPVIQAAGRASRRRPVFLLVLAQASQAVLPHEIADPQRAMLIPLLRTAQQEYPNLNIRHVDCEGHPAATARIVAAECGDPAREPEVAYRAGERLVSRLAPAAASGGIALRAAGRYLLSGGLGGIGRHLAAHLLAMPEVRLVLLGRRTEAALDADARATLERLRQAGAVEYVAADCGDGAALARLEPRIRDALGGRLDGVFHLAGTVTMAPLERLSAADLAGNLHAKVEGSRALQRLAARLEAEFLVHFGSLNGYFGGAEVGAYAVANRYQLAQSEAGLARGGPKLRCINWSMWDETGISRGYRFKELSQRLGYRTLAPEQALSVLEAALAAPHPVCFVGIDETVPRMHAETTARPLPLAEIEIAEAGDGTGLAAVTDAFGTPVAVTRSAAVAAESAAREAPACRTAVEDLVAQVWREVLELEQRPAPEDNLFDLGAQSLLMPRLQNRLAEALGIEIDILDLFEHCTLQTMADHLQRSVAAPSPAAAGR